MSNKEYILLISPFGDGNLISALDNKNKPVHDTINNLTKCPAKTLTRLDGCPLPMGGLGCCLFYYGGWVVDD